MESYRHEVSKHDRYCAVIAKNKSTGKMDLVVNIHDENFIRDYWKNNERNWDVLEVKPLTNVTAYKYFQYWMIAPKSYKTEDQRLKKFDFLKYVCGADLSDKYRGIEYIHEIQEAV